MNFDNQLPILITFDGEARSGKGTVVQAVKDYIRDQMDKKVMLIDAGQVFRVLVVGATRAGIDLDDPVAIDKFLADDDQTEQCVKLVKQVYDMDKTQRDSLLYTNEVGRNSAKIGARPLSQAFKDELLKRWLRDARDEGYEIVLLDGRALEETGSMLEEKGLCDFKISLYFICDATVGARRTLGYADRSYHALSDEQKNEVNELVDQINARNESDRVRKVQPIVRPDSEPSLLPKKVLASYSKNRVVSLINTSAEMSKTDMVQPVAEFVEKVLNNK